MCSNSHFLQAALVGLASEYGIVSRGALKSEVEERRIAQQSQLI